MLNLNFTEFSFIRFGNNVSQLTGPHVAKAKPFAPGKCMHATSFERLIRLTISSSNLLDY